VESEIAGKQAGTNCPVDVARQVEPAMLSEWRRALSRGEALDNDRSQAPALLQASVDAVRSQIQSVDIDAAHDEQGRIRISASVTYAPDGTFEDDAESVVRMWGQIKALHEQLDASRAEESRLQAELQAAEKALEYTKTEVANLWRVMTTRNLKQAVRRAAGELQEGGKVLNLSEQRTRIRSKIADVRELARRRRWPWSLVG
jgi:chromosome segregation ATPase